MNDCMSKRTVGDTHIIFGRLEADLSRLPSRPEMDDSDVGESTGHPPKVPPFFFLGYPLYLSPTEQSLMRVLLDAAIGSDRDGWISPSLPEKMFTLSEQQIAVHILRINRKAAVIGGRKLIVSHKGLGYRLNPYM